MYSTFFSLSNMMMLFGFILCSIGYVMGSKLNNFNLPRKVVLNLSIMILTFGVLLLVVGCFI
ncbi:hypothetical protein BSA145_21095 (plasmid) [Bacillus safensis]|uniref:Uncharacterized protein n=1 Tax=Bacillus safensis TaxID=561879 RepID=A0A1L6ZPD7_BACIA|nr:hypothetical protein BSA145_21095 [Bacillus safensis]